MIATILYSSPTFEAVDYNERKCSQGAATQIVMENFGYLEGNQDATTESLKQYLQDYSQRNDRIQKPQLHVAFSCKGQEMNTEELVSFARSWLAEMGYNNPQQPLLIYAHHDTDNNHIHVITSRVDNEGKKIDHAHERVRSKAFVDKTLGVDTKQMMDAALTNSLDYKFTSVAQWKAVLETSGYDVAEKGEELKIARNGAYVHTLPKAEIESRISRKETYVDKRRTRQLKALLLKFRNLSCEKEELQTMMKRKFGVDLVFLGSKDTPRGYLVVDHKLKRVYKGSDILKVDQLLAFESKEAKLKRIDAFIDAQLEVQPRLTSKELHKLLKKHYSASYKGGKVYFGMHEEELQPYMQETLKYNNKVSLLSGYRFSTVEEREALGLHFKVRATDLSSLATTEMRLVNSLLLKRVEELIEGQTTLSERLAVLRSQDLAVVNLNNKFFVIDVQRKCVVCLDDNGIDLKQRAQKQRTQKQQSVGRRGRGVSQQGENGGGIAANREWEVGTHGSYNDIDDERRLKR